MSNSSGRRKSVKAICPQYKGETSSMVYCDGEAFGRAMTLHQAFATRDACKEWKQNNCYSNYQHCKFRKEKEND